MPKVFEINGYKFFFFSNEGCPIEPCHIHVRKGSGLAKFWIDPEVQLCDSINFSEKKLKFIRKQIEDNRLYIKEVWNEYFC